MPILQDPKALLGGQFDESMQYSIVPTYRVPSRQGAGWKPVGSVIDNGGERMQVIARKKSRQLLEQEAVQKERRKVVEGRYKPRPNPAPRWAPSPMARMIEAKKKVLLAEKGLYDCSAEELVALKLEWEGKDPASVEPPKAKPEAKEAQGGKVRVGSARKRVSRGSRDSDAAVKSGSRWGRGKGGGTKRPAKVVPVLPDGDDT